MERGTFRNIQRYIQSIQKLTNILKSNIDENLVFLYYFQY